jgi:RHS repeat-associated protein
MATRINFNGKVTTYGYDSLNRQTSRTPDSSLTGQIAVTSTYTATGKRKTMADASGTTTWNYDNRDRVISKITPQGTLTYTWDPHSNVASVTSSNANGVSVAYGYDSLNRLSGVTDNRLASQTTYTYDNVNNLATFTYPNGMLHSYAYDAKDQLTGLQVGKVPGVFANYTETFGDAGHKLTNGELSGRAVAYAYDNTYRLLNETITGDPISTNNGALTYVLDAAANRQSRASTLAVLSVQSFAFDTNDRLTSDTYDNNGNTLASGGNSYAYDFEDRLTNFNNGAVTMIYDGNGNRVAKTAAGVTTKYLVDELTPTGYPQVAEEIVATVVQRRYTHGTMRISQTAGAVTSYYGYDAGGSVRQLADPTGAVTDTYTYDAFGSLVASTGTTPNVYLYRAEQFDPVVGLYYLRARWMNPQTGRFLTRDPYEGDGTVSCCKYQQFKNRRSVHHLYEYTHADPVNYMDPSGQSPFIEFATVNQVVAGGLAAIVLVGSFLEVIECV